MRGRLWPIEDVREGQLSAELCSGQPPGYASHAQGVARAVTVVNTEAEFWWNGRFCCDRCGYAAEPHSAAFQQDADVVGNSGILK